MNITAIQHLMQQVRMTLPSSIRACAQFVDWPPVTEYHHLFSKSPFPFVCYDREKVKESGGYELFIHSRGTIPTRERNWHDFYNALSWHLYPRSKRRLHQCQIQYTVPKGRSPEQNGLTLFDECGCLLVTTGEWVERLIAEHRWEELFIHRREQLNNNSALFTFGHALFEAYQTPYIGLTGKCIVVQQEQSFFHRSLAQQYAYLDDMIADKLPLTPRELLPLPLLGWPGWWPDNEDALFYENTRYFRPKRTKK